MKTIIYIIAGLILLAIGPQLILGIIFTVGIYYFLYAMFKGITSGSSGGSGGSRSEILIRETIGRELAIHTCELLNQRRANSFS